MLIFLPFQLPNRRKRDAYEYFHLFRIAVAFPLFEGGGGVDGLSGATGTMLCPFASFGGKVPSRTQSPRAFCSAGSRQERPSDFYSLITCGGEPIRRLDIK